MRMTEKEIHSSWRHETSSRVRDSSLVKLQAKVGRMGGGGAKSFVFILKFHIRFIHVISVSASPPKRGRSNLRCAVIVNLSLMTCQNYKHTTVLYTAEPGYNDIGLYDTLPIASEILWHQLIRDC
jgi:hypothetical protein